MLLFARKVSEKQEIYKLFIDHSGWMQEMNVHFPDSDMLTGLKAHKVYVIDLIMNFLILL